MISRMDWVLIGGIVFSLWASTRLLGNERQRRLDEQAALDTATVPATPDAPMTEPIAH